MSDAKRPDPKRRSPTSRPGAGGRAGASGRAAARKPAAKSPVRKETQGPAELKAKPEVGEPIRQSIAAVAEQQSEQRLGFTARRAAILAAVVCVLTLTIAGPVRTYFAQRTEMKQLAATEAALRSQIADLEQQKVKLADPVFVAAQARERLGFVMPGDIPYQVQLPPGAVVPADPGSAPPTAKSNDPWYTALWKTIADAPHGAPAPVLPPGPPVIPGEVPPPLPDGPPPAPEPSPAPGG
jgi:cell division protein FtsB